MAHGAVTFRDLATMHPVATVKCKRCDREGRYRVSGLMERYGADAKLPEIAAKLEQSCERKGQIGGCFVYFKELSLLG